MGNLVNFIQHFFLLWFNSELNSLFEGIIQAILACRENKMEEILHI